MTPKHLIRGSIAGLCTPYRRFARTLAGACARLGADAVRYSFTVVDFHHLLLAGFTGAPHARFFDHAGPYGHSRCRAVAFGQENGVGARERTFTAQWLDGRPLDHFVFEGAIAYYSCLMVSKS